MSALAQQQQQSTQVQQPSQQQGAQQGPVPEAASFGAGNAVDFQSAYGNEAVAGMAGVEGAGVESGALGASEAGTGECVEGDTFVKRDPDLAKHVIDTLTAAEASAAGVGAWSGIVPAEHMNSVNEAQFGLEALCDYVHDAVSDANKAAKEDDDEAFADARWALEQLTSKVTTAMNLLEAQRQYYEGANLTSIASTGKSLEEHATALADYERLTSELADARTQVADGMQGVAQGLKDQGEILVQIGAQTILAGAVDALLPAAALCGPGAQVCASAIVVEGAVKDMEIDGALGTDPQGASTELLKLAGQANLAEDAAIALATAEAGAKGSGSVAKFVPMLGQALTLLDGATEYIEAMSSIITATREAEEGLRRLIELTDEAEALRKEHSAPLQNLVGELPGSIQLAAELSSIAADEIASIRAEHGGSLYDPV